MNQADIEKIIAHLANIDEDVNWVEVRFLTNTTRGEIVFVRNNENNDFRWCLTNLKPIDSQ